MPVSRSRSPGDPQILSDLLPIRESHSLSLGLGLSFARASYRTQGNAHAYHLPDEEIHKVNLGGSHGVGVHVPPGMWMCSPTWKSLRINGVLWRCPHVGTIRYELHLQPLEDRLLSWFQAPSHGLGFLVTSPIPGNIQEPTQHHLLEPKKLLEILSLRNLHGFRTLVSGTGSKIIY